MDQITTPLVGMSPEEKAFREQQVAYARGTVRLDGFTPDPEFEELNRRYIAGEITFEQHGNAILGKRHR